MKKKPDGELLNTEQVAERLNVTRQHVSDLLRSGKLPGTKIGRDWLINSNDLPIAENRPGRGRPAKKASTKTPARKATPGKNDDDDEEE